jgi:hypothetical protein
LPVIRQEWRLTNVEDPVLRRGVHVYEALERHRPGGPFRESGKNFSEVGKSTGSDIERSLSKISGNPFQSRSIDA